MLRVSLPLVALALSGWGAYGDTPPATTTITDAATPLSAMPRPHWLRAANAPTPGLAQPSSITPGSLPYPTTGRPRNGLIAQPQYVAPSTPAVGNSPDGTAAGDNRQLPQASAPPSLSTPLAPPKQFHPPSTAAAPPKAPEQRSRFWQLILGPSQAPPATQDPFTAMAQGERATVAAAMPGTRSAVPPTRQSQEPVASSFAGSSLWDQLLGNSPAPRQPAPPTVTPATTTPAKVSGLTSQLLPASAQMEEVITMELPPGPRPTLSDIEDAKTPATSMTVGRPGIPAYKDTPILSAQQPAPQLAGMPPVPTIPAQSYAGTFSALWQPLAMTNDVPPAAMPVESAGPSAAQLAKLPESERVPSLLRPWYATNPPLPSNASSGATVVAGSAAPESIPEALAQSSLGRQLSMTTTEDLRTPMTAAIDAQVKNSQEPWDGRVIVEWPLMANPFTMTDKPPAAAPTYVATGPNGAHQVAYLQEPLPDPTATGSNADPLVAPGDDKEDDSGAGQKKDGRDTLVGARTIGTAPQDTSLDFLRTQTVLLEPGKSQFDIGIEYVLTENDFPILLTDGGGNVVGVDNVEFKGRELTVPMELRYGLLRRLQGFIQVPVGWANVQAAINNFDEFDNDGGVGDIGFGLTAQLRDAYKDCPYIIGTLAGLAPTGGDPFGVFGAISPNAPSLGNGFWAISGNLLWVQTRYDPVVLFYGFGARYQFEHEYIGIEFQPGTEFNYTLGTGFAVNERVTLSTQFFGAYIEELKADGERVEGTIQEPMTIRMAATLAKPCNRIVEPFVAFGLTDDSISSNFGITWTY